MKQTIDQLIETGDSERIFSHAIQGYGRGQVHTYKFANISKKKSDLNWEIRSSNSLWN
jgi:hypothetical protein